MPYMTILFNIMQGKSKTGINYKVYQRNYHFEYIYI